MPEAGPGRTAAEDPARQEALIANLRAQVQTLEAQVLACRRTEAQLRESETRFRNLAETTSDWIWEVDTAGVYTYVSPQVRDLLGYEPSEVLGRTPFDFIPDDERARVWPAFEAACARREPIRALVNRNRRKDGRIVVLETSGVPFAGPQGELAGYRGIDRDITERVRVEEVRQFLAEAGRALVSSLDCRTTLESVAHLAVPVLADWVVIDVRGAEPGSHTAAVAYVDPQKEPLARELQRRYPPDPDTLEAYRRVLQWNEPQLVPEITAEGLRSIARSEGELRLLRELRPTSVSVVPLAARGRTFGAMMLAATAASGRHYGPADLALAEELGRRIALAVDNTRLYVEAQSARADAERRAAELDAAISAMADGLLVYGPSGEQLRMNPAAQSILAYTPTGKELPAEEAAAVYHIETLDGKSPPFAQLPPARALRGETVHGAVFVVRRPDGKTIWVSSSAAPIRSPDGTMLGAVVTFTDITAQHALQEQMQDLLRAVSHDLRNPLAAVRGQAEMLLRMLDRAGLAGRERKSAEAILSSAERMDVLIQDLVDAARLGAGQVRLSLEPVDLRSFVLQLLERVGATMDTRRVRVIGGEGLPPVLADLARLERILVNLLSNALKYSAPGSEVTVTLSHRNGEVTTAVSDHGPGIAPEEQPHLFERFYRARAGRERPEGLGLGLYITRGLVEAHGGRIWVESRVGVGSTFSFSLPVVEPP